MASLTAKANTGAGTDALAGVTTPDGFAGAVTLVDDTGAAINAGNPAPVVIVSGGDDAPDWRAPFFRKQIEEYEEKLAALAAEVKQVRKPKRKAAAAKRIEAVLDDVRADPAIPTARFEAVGDALERLVEATNAMRALQAIEDERVRLLRMRRRRDDEAIIALLLH